ncbi:MAG TPA: ATP-binding protein [Gemmatimonadales bacterium]
MDTALILTTLELGAGIVSPDGTITEWTETAAALTGCPPGQMVGRHYRAALPPTWRHELEHTVASVLSGGEPQALVVPSRGGHPDSDLMVQVRRSANGHVVLALRKLQGTVPGALAGVAGWGAMDAERRNYRQLFNALPTAAFALDIKGRIAEANAAAAELLGLSNAASALGASLYAWIAPNHRQLVAAALEQAIRGRHESDVSFETNAEPAREIRAVVAPVDPTHESMRALLLAVEVSRELLLQRKLLRTDRLSQMGALVSGVAHELNNPLAAIAAFGELLAKGTVDPQLRDSAQIIHTEAMRAGRIVRTLLDFARQRPRQAQPVNLADVVERVLSLQRTPLKKARVRVDVVIAPNLPLVTGDPQELQQVVLNAVVNAQQAIAETGRPGRIAIHATCSDEHVVLSVDDNGPGIPPEVLERAFEPFFTTKGEDGTGLGLSISQGLVRAMGGRMWLQNVDQGGARFAVELPVVKEAAAGETPGDVSATDRQRHVLVVEDDPAVRRGMVLMTERLGHVVANAGGFDEALRLLASRGSTFDAFLVDVHLDDDHTGFELFAHLEREGAGRERHVVFTTGDSISLQTRDLLERSGRPVLRKPFSLDELREVLARASGN